MAKNLIKTLLIEDNPADALLLKEALGNDLLADFQVTVVEQLRTGLEMLGREKFDILLLDLGLPDSNGLKTFETAYQKFPTVPMIVLSGMADAIFAQEAVQTGAQDYLIKGEEGWGQAGRAIRYAVERSHAQLARSASEARFSTFFHSSPIATAIIRTSDSCILEVNEAWCEITGYQREEVVGHETTALGIWVNPEQHGEFVQVLKRDGTIHGFESKMRHRSGTVAEVLFSAELVEWGDTRCVLSMSQDITERKRNEKRIEEQERFIRATFDSLPEQICVLDENYRIISTNQGWRHFAEQNNYIKNDFFGMNYLSVCNTASGESAEEAGQFAEGLEAVMKGDLAEFSLEYPCDSPTEKRWFMARIVPFPGDGARRLVVSHTNITSLKLYEEALQSSEERHRLISGMISDYVYSGVVFPNGTSRTEWIDGAFEQITNYTLEEIKTLPLGFASLLLPEDIEKVTSQQHFLFEDQSLDIEYRIRRKDGQIRWLFDQMVIIADKSITDGVRILGAVQDITDRKNIEEALRLAEEKYRTIFENSLEGIFQSTPAGRFLTVNPALARILGYDSPEDMITSVTDVTSQVYVRPQDRAESIRLLREQSGNLTAHEVQVRRKDGSLVWISENARSVKGADGNILYFEGTLEDISTRKQAEEKLAQRTRQLTLIHETTRKLNDSLQARSVYEVIYASISELVPCDTLFISSFDSASKMITLNCGWHDGQPIDVTNYKPIPLEPEGSGTQSQVIRTRDSLLVPDFQARLKKTQVVQHFDGAHQQVDSPPEDADIPRSALVTPLIVENEIFGVIQVFSYRLNAYTEDDLQILNGFSSQAAIALSNAYLYEQAQKELAERKLAQEALQAAENKYRMLVERLPVIVYTSELGSGGNWLYVSPQIEKLLGFTVEEWMADPAPWSRQVHPEDLLRQMELEEKAYANSKLFSDEYRMATRDGREIWIRDSAQILPPLNGGNPIVQGVLMDVTERKQAEINLQMRTEDLALINSLNESANRGDSIDSLVKLFVEQVPRILPGCHGSSVYLLDPTGTDLELHSMKFFSPVIEKIETLIGRSIPKLSIPLKKTPYFQSLIENSIGTLITDPNTLQQWIAEFTETTFIPTLVRNGFKKLIPQIHSLLEINSVIVIPLVSSGKAIGLVDVSSPGIFTEEDLRRVRNFSTQVTSVILRKRSDEALGESKRLLQAVIDTTPMRIFWKDKESRYLGCNPAFAADAGVAHPRDLIGKDDFELSWKTQAAYYRNDDLLVINSEDIKPPSEEVQIKPDGTSMWIRISKVPLRNNQKQVIGLLGVYEDVTNRKLADEQLLVSQRRYRALFEDSPLAIWEEDFSLVKQHIDSLKKKKGITDFQAYFLSHPQEALECAHLIKIVDVNSAALKMFRSPSKESLIKETEKSVSEGEAEHNLECLVAIAEGRTSSSWDGKDKTMDGEPIEISLSWSVVPGYEHDFSKVIVTTVDITKRKQIEDALRESEEKYRLFFENSMDAILLTAPNGRIYAANPAACKMFERTEAEICVLGRDGLVNTHDPRYSALLAERALAGKATGEMTMFRKDGSPFPVEISSAVFEVNQDIVRSSMIIRDTTERKLAEEKVRQKDIEFRKLSANVPDLIFQFTRRPDGTYHVPIASEGIRNIFGCTPEDVLEDFSPIARVIYAEDSNRVIHDIENSARNLSFFTCEFRVDLPGKGIRWIYSRSSPEQLADGSVTWYGFNTDITERKNAEEVLRKSEDRFRSLFENAPVGVLLADPLGKVLEVNPTALEILGSPSAEATRKINILTFPPLIQAGISADIQNCLTNARLLTSEHPYTSKWGKSIELNLRFAPLLDAEGKVVLLQILIEDVTARKHAEEMVLEYATTLETRVEERTAELVRANRAKDEFLANMSHELRTPLNGILGFSETLLEEIRGTLNERQKQSVQIIHSSGEHLLGLINDILDVSKIESGMFELLTERVIVNDICRSSLNFIKQLAGKKSIHVEYKLDPAASTLVADPKRLKQILVNLLNNAVKFTPEMGKIVLEVTADAKAELMRFSVTDTGIGISTEDQKKLFQPFVQVDSSLSRQYEGTGLGLMLVKKLVEMHNGTVELSSQPEQGSCFSFTLPWSQEIQDRKRPALPLSAEGEARPNQDVETAVPGKILLAEDNENNVFMIRDYLEYFGYELIIAHDGREAVLKAEQTLPDLILMDVQMPTLNGLEATLLLRADPRFAAVPIIAFTAFAMPGDRERCLAAGMNDYLSKPVNLKELHQMIGNLLDRSSSK